MNATHTSESMACHTKAMIYIISSILIIFAGLPSIHYGTRSIHALTKGTKGIRMDMKEKTIQLYNSGHTADALDEMNYQNIRAMLCSVLIVFLLLVAVPIHFWVILDMSNGFSTSKSCHLYPTFYFGVTVSLLVCDVVILLATLVSSCFYISRYVILRKVN